MTTAMRMYIQSLPIETCLDIYEENKVWEAGGVLPEDTVLRAIATEYLDSTVSQEYVSTENPTLMMLNIVNEVNRRLADILVKKNWRSTIVSLVNEMEDGE